MQPFTTPTSTPLSLAEAAMCQILSHAQQNSLPLNAASAPSPPELLSKALHSRLSLATALSDVAMQLGPSSSRDVAASANNTQMQALQNQLHASNDRIAQLEYHLHQKVQELEAYQQRAQKLEALYNYATGELNRAEEQAEAHKVQAQQILNQHIQIISLEEQLKIVTAGSQDLQSKHDKLQNYAALLQQQLAAMCAGGSSIGVPPAPDAPSSTALAQLPLQLTQPGALSDHHTLAHAASGREFTCDQEIWPGGQQTPHRTSSSLLSTGTDTWAPSGAGSAPHSFLTAADSWQLTSSQGSANYGIGSTSWDVFPMGRQHSLSQLLDAPPSHAHDADVHDTHVAGLLPFDIDRMDAQGSDLQAQAMHHNMVRSHKASQQALYLLRQQQQSQKLLEGHKLAQQSDKSPVVPGYACISKRHHLSFI